MKSSPKGGRARTLIAGRKVNLYLDGPTLVEATRIGHGNMSAGIREAVAIVTAQRAKQARGKA